MPSIKPYVALVLLGTNLALAQNQLDAGTESPATVAPDSPRASVTEYLIATREGRFADAARHLDLRQQPATVDRATLARRLQAVLDRHLWLRTELLSPDSTGNLTDGLAPQYEDIGQIPIPGGGTEPVRLARITSDGHRRWVFSASTIARIDAWYGALQGRWMLEHLPEPLLRPGPRDLLWWQWLALLLLLPLVWGGGLVLSWMSRSVARRIVSRTSAQWDDALLARLGAPLTLGWALLLFYLALPYLTLNASAYDSIQRALKASVLLVVFWALLRSVDVLAQGVLALPWAAKNPASRTLVQLGARAGKVTVAMIAAIAVLSELGYPVASLIAGLGIGGLALALAGQKTVENLFGAFSIGLDQPIREGDFVRIEDFVGTVERIGLRSTQIRTLDRTVITIPNGRLAEMRLETFAARDRIRLACTLGVTYSTSAAQMRTILLGIEKCLREHPLIWPDDMAVRFSALGASSLDIEIMAWFRTADWGQFRTIRQELLLQFMEIVEKAGCSFAFPTQTVHVVQETSPKGS